MTSKQLTELSQVLAAAASGMAVEFKMRSHTQNWHHWNPERFDGVDTYVNEYRIKAEPKELWLCNTCGYFTDNVNIAERHCEITSHSSPEHYIQAL